MDSAEAATSNLPMKYCVLRGGRIRLSRSWRRYLLDGDVQPWTGYGSMRPWSRRVGAREFCSLCRRLSTHPVRRSGVCCILCQTAAEVTRSGRYQQVLPRAEKGKKMFSVIHTDGSGDENPPIESLSALYDELVSADQEHGDVAVVHENSGWSMSAHRDGRLWRRLIDGDIEGILVEPWQPGYIQR